MTLFLVIISAFLVGLSKTSIGGLGIIIVPLMALAFESKVSTGILLPMLVLADILALIYYKRHCEWKIFIKIFPVTGLGVIIGYHLMSFIPTNIFNGGLGLLITLFVIADFKGWGHSQRQSLTFTLILGLFAGITSMMANAAGPLFGIYLLGMGLDKKTFIGTRVWFFLLLNIYKLPFSNKLGFLNENTILWTLMYSPFILLGAVVGIYWMKKINLNNFKGYIRTLALLSGLFFIYKSLFN